MRPHEIQKGEHGQIEISSCKAANGTEDDTGQKHLVNVLLDIVEDGDVALWTSRGNKRSTRAATYMHVTLLSDERETKQISSDEAASK